MKEEKHMSFSNELEKKCSRGSLINNKAFKGAIITIKSLDINTANRINERVSRSAKQYQVESQNTMKLAKETYSD